MAGGSKAVNYTVQSGDTLNSIVSGVATNINADTDLQGISVSAVAVTPTSGVSVVNLVSASKNATTFAKSLSGGATETIALSKNVGVSQATFNTVNELTGISAGGNAHFQGNTDRPVLPVTVAGSAVDMPTSQSFSGNAALSSGSNSVNVSATAGGGSGTTTNTHKLEVVGAGSQTLTYDDNGNLTSDGTNSFAWDAENRLIQITYPSSGNNSVFTYDPFGRMVKIVETVASSVTSTKQHIWCSDDRCEERDGSGNPSKQFFADGQINASTNYFYELDHLGSIRTMTDDNGDVQSAYSFDPFGRQQKVAGGQDSDFQFAGYYMHARSGLSLTVVRAYAPSLGKWLSRDLLPETQVLNSFCYCLNSPVNYIDPLGLKCCPPLPPPFYNRAQCIAWCERRCDDFISHANCVDLCKKRPKQHRRYSPERPKPDHSRRRDTHDGFIPPTQEYVPPSSTPPQIPTVPIPPGIIPYVPQPRPQGIGPGGRLPQNMWAY